MPIVWEFRPSPVNPIALLEAGAAAAATAGAETLLQASQPLVPVDTGEMQASGKVTPEGTRAHVSYNRTGADGYDVAVRQHEDLELHHPNGGQAKFLEAPMHSAAGEILAAEAAALRAFV